MLTLWKVSIKVMFTLYECLHWEVSIKVMFTLYECLHYESLASKLCSLFMNAYTMRGWHQSYVHSWEVSINVMATQFECLHFDRLVSKFYAMVACRLHDTAGSLAWWGFHIQTHWQSRPTCKIQTHWLGHKVVHIVTNNIQKLKSCFHQYFIYIHVHKFNKNHGIKRKPYGWQVHEEGLLELWPQPYHPRPQVKGDTAGVTTRGVLPHTPVNHTVFS